MTGKSGDPYEYEVSTKTIKFLLVLYVVLLAGMTYVGTSGLQVGGCRVPSQFLVVKAAGMEVWNVVHTQTDRTFRNTDLCSAVKEAMEATSFRERLP